MTNDDNSVATSSDLDMILDAFGEHLQGVAGNVLNARWDEVNFHLEGMEAITNAADSATKPYFEIFMQPMKDYAAGFQKLTTAETPEEKERAVEYLIRARDALRKAKTEKPEFKDNPGLTQMVLGIETQIIGVQEQLANARADTTAAAILGQQRAQLFQEMTMLFQPDDPTRQYLDAIKLLEEAVPNVTLGTQAMVEMNLDLAQSYLQESSKSLDAMQDLFSKTKTDELIVQAAKNMAVGIRQMVLGQDAYVRVLRAAIIGDVNRSDVEALEKAEKSFLDGANLITNASIVAPGVFGRLDVVPQAAVQARLTHNLRTLCERSISPKQITATAAPKVVFYFIGTFIVLLIGLPTSGLVAHLGSTELMFVLIVSLLVSIIGAFGFEATRLVPLLDAFSRWLPWKRKNQKGSSESQITSGD